MNRAHEAVRYYLVSLAVLAAFVVSGCDNKETVLDVEGPDGGGVAIEKDRDTGAISVDVDSDE
jgi:hypothetical protein